jgi:hypothetical protein
MARVSFSDVLEAPLKEGRSGAVCAYIELCGGSGKALVQGESLLIFGRRFCCDQHQTVFTEDPWPWAAPRISASLAGW